MRTAEVERLRKSYGAKLAVDDLSLELSSDEVLGLTDPNGAGKSTTIRAILGLLHPDAGRTRMFGGALDNAAKNRVGYLPEERGACLPGAGSAHREPFPTA
jgi:ABC-2 type transport system ATP-binding protein